jgi:hypothetical protein
MTTSLESVVNNNLARGKDLCIIKLLNVKAQVKAYYKIRRVYTSEDEVRIWNDFIYTVEDDIAYGYPKEMFI